MDEDSYGAGVGGAAWLGHCISVPQDVSEEFLQRLQMVIDQVILGIWGIGTIFYNPGEPLYTPGQPISIPPEEELFPPAEEKPEEPPPEEPPPPPK